MYHPPATMQPQPGMPPHAQPTVSAKKPSAAAIFFAVVAIAAGAMAFVTAGIRGHSAGWELMAVYTGPSIGAALIGLAIRRAAITWVGLGFAVLSAVSFFLGA